MTKLYVVSKSDLKKLAGSRLLSDRSFSVVDGEELDLDKLASGHLSDKQSFAVVDEAELNSNERAKLNSGHPSKYLYFSMLYLGLFIGFLITTIAVDMSTNKHKHLIFIVGTILFGAVALFLFIWWLMIYRQHIPHEQIKELPTYEDVVQID